MRPRYLFLFISLLLFILSGCRTYQDPQMYHTYEPRVLSTEAGDTYLLRVQGKGQTREDAINNALMNAVRDVIFKDIQVTYGDHKTLMRIINNPLEEENHSEFFQEFFAPGGSYSRFVTPVKNNREYFSSSTFHTVLLNVKIDRKGLKTYLAERGIL